MSTFEIGNQDVAILPKFLFLQTEAVELCYQHYFLHLELDSKMKEKKRFLESVKFLMLERLNCNHFRFQLCLDHEVFDP